MVTHVAKARVVVEEVKIFFVTNSLEDSNKKFDKLYMVLIRRSLHSKFGQVYDQVLVGDKIPSMNNFINRLLQVPTLLKDENSIDVIEITLDSIYMFQAWCAYNLYALA